MPRALRSTTFVRVSLLIGWLIISNAPFSLPSDAPPLPSLGAQEHSFSSVEITAHLSAEQRATLAMEGMVVAFGGDPTFSLLPPFLASRTEQMLAEAGERPLIVEQISAISLPSDRLKQITPLSLYNLARSVSGLEEVIFVSPNSGKSFPLYTSSYAIDHPDTRNRQPDPIVSAIPALDTQYISQSTRNIGTNIYQSRYIHQNAITSIDITNLHTIWYAIFPVIQKEQLRIFSTIIPTEHEVLLYNAFLLRAANIPSAFQNSIAEGILGFIQAIHDWFGKQIANS